MLYSHDSWVADYIETVLKIKLKIIIDLHSFKTGKDLMPRRRKNKQNNKIILYSTKKKYLL